MYFLTEKKASVTGGGEKKKTVEQSLESSSGKFFSKDTADREYNELVSGS